LSAIFGAKKAGANPIIAIDLDDQKLEFASKFGATHGINASKLDPVEEIHKLTPGNGGRTMMGLPISGADFAFDCIGIQKTMGQTVLACRSAQFGGPGGGTAILVGLPTTTVELDGFDVLVNEKAFKGSCAGSTVPERDFVKFIKWYQEGDLDLEAMVTARYTMDQINEAMRALENGEIAGRAILEF
jgi:Zn-dependent alcohol dehydrogenase